MISSLNLSRRSAEDTLHTQIDLAILVLVQVEDVTDGSQGGEEEDPGEGTGGRQTLAVGLGNGLQA